MTSEYIPHSSPLAQGAGSAELIDSVRMRRAGPGLLSLALIEARNHTLTLFTPYEKALASVNFAVPQRDTLNPPLWTLGHIGWFQEWWIARNLQRAQGRRCAPGASRLASIDPNADRWWDAAQVPQAARWSLDLPDLGSCRAWLLETLESTLDLLDKSAGNAQGAPDDALYFYRRCLFYEDMQSELLAQTAQTLGLPFNTALLAAYTPPPVPLRHPLLVPATLWQMGSTEGEGQGFSFDNERPVHAVSVPEFEIDAQAVSWSQYVEFVGDGAYDLEALWHPDGWTWLQQQAQGDGEGRRAPRYVEQIGVASGAVMQTRFGQATRMLGNQPALHVSWWEADAWCRWAGRRLPAEVEWEVAACTAARRGFRWGDVWEWTGTTYRPYPGFTPDLAEDYSPAVFGAGKVLRGGSFATRGRMKHPKYRRSELPGRDDIFCGFRSCAL